MGHETWVITGPLWLPSLTTHNDSGGTRLQYSYAGLGTPPSVVAVPTHFYKVVAVVLPQDARNSDVVLTKFAAFVLPNSNFTSTTSIRLVDFTVRVTDLEAVTGLEFFPALLGASSDHSDAQSTGDNPLRKDIADALTDEVRLQTSENGKSKESNANTLILAPNSKEWSKGRHKRMKRLLKDNAPISFQHLCNKNEACLKLLKV